MRSRWWAVGLSVCLLPALVLTSVRLTDPTPGRLVQVQAFTPYAVLGYTAVGVAAGVVALLLRRHEASIRPLLVPAAAAVVGVLLHGWWVAPQLAGEDREVEPGAERQVVMTANLLAGSVDGADVAAVVRERDVGLLVLNEVTADDLAEMDAAGGRTALPYRVGRPGVDYDGTIVLAARPVRLVETLATAHDSLVVEWEGRTVLAVHPKPPTEAPRWHQDHAVILAAARTHDPALVLGDFNATPDHEPMRRLDDAGLRGTAEILGTGLQPTWPTDNKGFPVLSWLPPTVGIDHVLVDDDTAVLDTGTVDLPGSDHRGVLATVAPRA